MFSVVLGGDPVEYFSALSEIVKFTFEAIFKGLPGSANSSVFLLYVTSPILVGVFAAWFARKVVDFFRRI